MPPVPTVCTPVAPLKQAPIGKHDQDQLHVSKLPHILLPHSTKKRVSEGRLLGRFRQKEKCNIINMPNIDF